jgi:hypothetical protein
VCYFEIPERFLPFVRYFDSIQASTAKDSNDNTKGEESVNHRQYLMESMKEMLPGERALARFLMADQKRKNKTLKFIPVIIDGAS